MTLLDGVTYAGIFVFAITGALKARTSRMDIFGAGVMAFVTAYGGGTIRDLLIGVRPVNWVNDNFALLMVLSGTAVTFLFKKNVHRFRRTIFITDAMGIGFFTVVGIERSLLHGINAEYALIMGVITATFGGLVADILCNSVPSLLKRGELYATACAIGGIIYLVLQHIGLEYNTNLLLCVVLVAGIRTISKWKQFKLPGI